MNNLNGVQNYLFLTFLSRSLKEIFQFLLENSQSAKIENNKLKRLQLVNYTINV